MASGDILVPLLHVPWDGSDLGRYSKTIIKSSGEKDLTTISLPGYAEISGTLKKWKSSFPIIADELKPLFGLMKLGTHIITIEGKKYILAKYGGPRDIVVSTLEMSHPLRSVEFIRTQVQEIFGFREILGINTSFDSHILLRDEAGNGVYYPISFCECSTSVGKEKKCIPETAYKRWFDEKVVLSSAIRRICMIPEKYDEYDCERKAEVITELLFKYSNAISDVIERIDAGYSLYTRYISERILSNI